MNTKMKVNCQSGHLSGAHADVMLRLHGVLGCLHGRLRAGPVLLRLLGRLGQPLPPLIQCARNALAARHPAQI